MLNDQLSRESDRRQLFMSTSRLHAPSSSADHCLTMSHLSHTSTQSHETLLHPQDFIRSTVCFIGSSICYNSNMNRNPYNIPIRYFAFLRIFQTQFLKAEKVIFLREERFNCASFMCSSNENLTKYGAVAP